MPSKDQHVAKANHDEAFVASLDLATTPFCDWAVTALFYAALHYIEAYFATKGAHSLDHRARDSDIQREPAISGLYNDYNELKNMSINARYMTTSFKSTDVMRLQGKLRVVKNYILNLLVPRPAPMPQPPKTTP